ncbi:Transmembrane and TPR repeat-containing protein 2 [Araneus ventricosus]|uniref:Transmembrane and TPR repeat-containing protein 2 n=1 Tax=Araneus ventricosus TaxID=182803 RepID=A0A4Y2DCH0_ARAVE|nr:Transmembrane and TPR repeat-containing protein 2 [Araneus ventricosus]
MARCRGELRRQLPSPLNISTSAGIFLITGHLAPGPGDESIVRIVISRHILEDQETLFLQRMNISVHQLQASRNAEAETYYKIAVKLRPYEVTSHMNLGAMLHVNGKLQEAEASYLEALKLRPDDPITQNNLQKLRNLITQRKLRENAKNRS